MARHRLKKKLARACVTRHVHTCHTVHSGTLARDKPYKCRGIGVTISRQAAQQHQNQLSQQSTNSASASTNGIINKSPKKLNGSFFCFDELISILEEPGIIASYPNRAFGATFEVNAETERRIHKLSPVSGEPNYFENTGTKPRTSWRHRDQHCFDDRWGTFRSSGNGRRKNRDGFFNLVGLPGGGDLHSPGRVVQV